MTNGDVGRLKQAKERIRRVIEKYCSVTGYKLNPDAEIVETVLEGLARNKIKYGRYYCPCRIVTGKPAEDQPKACPCRWHKEEIERDGHCHCNLFFR
ncbi:MAG: ferredoxin:thioredoxin reductase [Elusimicrobia bacterium]|nr:ferredoxin:thioredoxin reductase [Elusimicrobiota bacterium]